MKEEIKFQPHNLGGYTLFLILTGALINVEFQNIFSIILSLISFFIGMYFYSIDNKNKNGNI